MLTLLGTLFLIITSIGIWLLRPKSKKLQRAIWLLLITGVLLFIVSVIILTYTFKGIDAVEPSYDLGPSWMVVSIVGAGIGFASVVSAFVATVVARAKKL